VQSKVYTLQTIERGRRFMLARSLDQERTRLLQMYDIDAKWVGRHLHVDHLPVGDRELDRWLDENTT